jgi:hypothetical protein
MIDNLIKLNDNKFLTVTFIKKDNTIRTINGRVNVTKYLKGGKCTLNKEKYIILYSLKDKGYRAINKETIINIKLGKLNIFNKG